MALPVPGQLALLIGCLFAFCDGGQRHHDRHPGGRRPLSSASLLRSSLDAANTPLVPLADEVRIVRDYLAIEQVRFGQRLQPALAIEPGIESVLVPRFSLQTLVETR